jgi:hypothetical protein
MQFCRAAEILLLLVLLGAAVVCMRGTLLMLSTHGRWSLAMSPDGICTWLDRRTGQVHRTEPADYRELAV